MHTNEVWNQKQRQERSTHLYVGSGFPRASQCIITFFSSESNGKITSSGSWTNTGPNSSLSVKMKKKKRKTERVDDNCAVHTRSANQFYSPITSQFRTERKDVQHHAVTELETAKWHQDAGSICFFFRLLSRHKETRLKKAQMRDNKLHICVKWASETFLLILYD